MALTRLLSTPSIPGLRRQIGLFDGIFMLIAAVIGAGIFSVPQQLAIENSSVVAVLLLWTMIGLLCLAASLVWAELGSRIPEAGSDFLAVLTVHGRHAAFVYGWAAFLITVPANRAALAIVAAEYLGHLIPVLKAHRVLSASVILVLLALINCTGMRPAVRFHSIVAALKLSGLAILAVVGLFLAEAASPRWWHPSASPSELPPLARLALSGLLVFFAYEGWDRIALMAGEMRRPHTDLPRVMSVAMITCIAVYLLINTVYYRLLGVDGVRASSAVGADSMKAVAGPPGERIVAALIAIAVIGGLSSSIMGSARKFYAMARSGTFFSTFGKVDARTGIPARAVLIQAVTGIVMLVTKQTFANLATSAVFLNLLFYMARVHSLFGLRRMEIVADEGGDGYRVPFYPVLPALVLALFLALFTVRLYFDWQRAWLDLAVVALGIPASWLWFARADRANGL